MLKRALFALVLVVPLLVAALAPLALAQGSSTLIAETRLPLSDKTKYPAVDTSERTVLVASNAEQSYARLWSKPDASGSFSNPALLGPAEGIPDNSSTSIFTAGDGTVYYVWANQNQKRVYLRTKAPGEADFGPTRTVTGTSPDPVEPEVGANEDGVFVFWREPDAPIKYRRSADGINWNVPTQNIFTEQALKTFDVAAGPGRRLIVGYTRGREDNIQAYTAIWNGSAFINERIPSVTDRDFANPSVSLKPDGGYFAAFRGAEEAVDGTWFAERSASGSWSQPARLVKGLTYSVSADVDPLGNVHLFWINNAAGGVDLFYVFRRAGQEFSGSPLLVKNGALPVFNLDAAANLADRSYGHAVGERFLGNVSVVQYYLFGAPVASVVASGVTIENGQQYTNKSSVAVAFAGVQGNPTQVRWRWGAPPTDSENDSNGYVAFANPLTVPAPPLNDPGACAEQTLYTQLASGSVVQAAPNQDSIVFDQAVQASVSIANPDAAFDRAFTRVPSVRVAVASPGECIGVSGAAVSGPVPNGSVSLAISGNRDFAAAVELTGGAGPKNLSVVVTDLLGNSLTVAQTVTYDPVAPILTNAGADAALVSNPQATVLTEFVVDAATVSDETRLYGLVLVNSVTPTGGGAATTGTAVVVPFSSMREVVQADGKTTLRFTWSLASGLPEAARVPGTYQVVARFADAAGNQSEGTITRGITLSQITYPRTNLPLLTR